MTLRSLLLTLPIVAGCAELPSHAKKQVDGAREDYSRRDLTGARTKLDSVLTDYGRYTGAAEAYYLRAKVHAETSNRIEALRDAKRCIELSTDKVLTAKAQAMAGTLEFESGNKPAAIRYFEAALPHLTEKQPTDLIRYRYATCLQHEGRWNDARREFAKMLQHYPGSDLAEHARRMQEWPVDYFAIQCGAFQDSAAATNLANRLKSAGLSARVEVRSRSGQRLHTVLVGQYPTYSAAQAALGSVKRHASGAVIAP